MNNGQLRGIGMHSLFPNIRGNNPVYPAGNPTTGTALSPATTPTQSPGNRPSDGNTIRKLSSAEGGIIFSQDYIYIGNSISDLILPKGVWDILIIGGGAGGGACAAGTNGTRSAGGWSASGFSFRGRYTSDGIIPIAVIIGAGGAGASTASANGSPGGTTEVFLPTGEWFVLGGSGGFGCSNTITGYGGIPGYPTVTGQGVTAAPYAFVYYGSGGGLNTSPIFTNGIAGSCIEAGPVGGGAGAATNSSLGGNGGGAGIIDGGGNVGSGNTGTTTAGPGQNASANSGCGGGGAGGSFTGGAAAAGGNGGSGWVEAFRVG